MLSDPPITEDKVVNVDISDEDHDFYGRTESETSTGDVVLTIPLEELSNVPDSIPLQEIRQDNNKTTVPVPTPTRILINTKDYQESRQDSVRMCGPCCSCESMDCSSSLVGKIIIISLVTVFCSLIFFGLLMTVDKNADVSYAGMIMTIIGLVGIFGMCILSCTLNPPPRNNCITT